MVNCSDSMPNRVSPLLLPIVLACSACHGHKARVPEADSDPVGSVAVSDPGYGARLFRGFYELTPDWRWTAQSFAVSVDPPDPPQRTLLGLDFTVPVELLIAAKTITLTAKVNGVEAGKAEYRKAGRYYFSREVPPKALLRRPAEVEFTLDKTARDAQSRPLGLIVVSVALLPAADFPRSARRNCGWPAPGTASCSKRAAARCRRKNSTNSSRYSPTWSSPTS